jgi:hypothetical protein
MERSWIGDGSPLFDAAELDRAVFQRVFGYLAAPGVKVPSFTYDWDMATDILRHVEEAWRPLSIEVERRDTTDPRLAWDVLIRTGRGSGYGGMGPTRGVAICRAALFLAANRARKWQRPE